MSSGSRGLLGGAFSLVLGLAFCALALVHYDDIRRALLAQAVAPAADQAQPVAAGRGGERRKAGSVVIDMGRDGHYHAEVEINGRGVEVLVDTGATLVALTYEDAERAGIFVRESDFTHRVSTANGVGRIAPITIERISIGEITVRNVQAGVLERGRLSKTLLGMSFLGRLSRTEMRAGVLVLED